MVLGIDVDGVLADFNTSFAEAVIEVTGTDLFPKDWREAIKDKTFPTTWNWDLDAGYTKEQSRKTWEQGILTSSKFWKSLAPLPGAVDAIKQFNRMSNEGHEVYFLTHRNGKKAKQQTEEWLYDLGMNYPTVLLTGNKLPVLDNLGVQFFIDDKLATVNEVYRAGVVKHLYLFNSPWNNEGREKGLSSVHTVEEALRNANLFKEEKRGRPRKTTQEG